MKPKKKLAVVIPAYNEEKVLGRTLKSLNPIIRPSDIFIISDASKDKTGEISKSFGINYTRNKNRLGKTRSLRKAIRKFAILKNYKFVLFLDADTRPDKNFFKIALRGFNNPKVACVCGQVKTEPKINIFIAFRALMYFVWQNFYKYLCSYFNAVTIAPGTASIYRTQALQNIYFDEKLIIEDFDMTFQIHRKRLGRIIYEPEAKIITQDPADLKDYLNQVTRWQLGFFQAAFKHKVPLGGQPFEIALIILISIEVSHSVLLLTLPPLLIWFNFFTLYPSILGRYIESNVLIYILALDILIVWGFSLLHVFASGKFQFLFFGPFLWLVQYVNIAAFGKALYLALFKSVYGTWVSPKRS